ncbi:MAG: hypothetical protein SF029_25910 [bacterium]|nr:hypothetical protein [bacterium]
MSVEQYVRAMPKVELRVRLEGGFRRETLQIIAEQNDIPESTKNYSQWLKLLDNPDFNRLDETIRVLASWLHYRDDITRVVYDLGVQLSKQNVKYAEVSVNPALFMVQGMSFEDFMNALNDGRDKVQRGWGVRLNWILVLPREEPRRADEIVRWATSVTGRKGGIVALGLSGKEDSQPIGQFERPFSNALKKDVPGVVQAGDVLQGEGILAALQQLNPARIVDGRGAADAPDVLQLLTDRNIPVDVSMARALCHGWVQNYAQFPLRDLYNADVRVTLNTDLPAFYKSALNDEYLAAVTHNAFTVPELEDLALNAVSGSLLPEDEKAAMQAEFRAAYAQLRSEHLSAEQTS